MCCMNGGEGARTTHGKRPARVCMRACVHGNMCVHACMQVGMLNMGPEFNTQFEVFFKVFMQQLAVVVPPTVNLPEA